MIAARVGEPLPSLQVSTTIPRPASNMSRTSRTSVAQYHGDIMDRIQLFQEALDACVQLQQRYGQRAMIESIVRQLQYLVSLATGQNRDRSRLKDIVIGTLAAKEVEHLDLQCARLLYDADSEARRM